MIAITRKDGIKFIAQAYRECLKISNKRLLAQDIHALSLQHGSYLCVMRHVSRQLEVVISTESGYLLGETVWDYFGRPPHLIFCEAIADTAHCLLVVVRDGAVHLDTRLLSSQIYDELLPIFSDTRAYEVYTFGDLPIRDTDTFGEATFKLPKQNVAQFNQLQSSVFERLLPSSLFELHPLPVVLRSKYLRRHAVTVMIALIIAVVGVSGWYGGLLSPSPQVIPPMTVVPMQNYEVALTSPKPSEIIDELTNKIDQLYLIPGWQAAHITFGTDHYQVEMLSQGGDLWYLTDWAKQHYYDLHITSSGAELMFESHLAKRTLPKSYPTTSFAVDTFMTRIKQVLMDNAVHVDFSGPSGVMQETKLTLDLKELSPDLLDLIGQELENLPLSLSSIDLRLQDGLINGKIQLSIWGT